jgi:hypothetical protein
MHCYTRFLVAKQITKEPLINSSLNGQSAKNKKCDFCFSHKISRLLRLILAAHPCAAGKSE